MIFSRMRKNASSVRPKTYAFYIPYHDNFDVVHAPNTHCIYIGDGARALNAGIEPISSSDNLLCRNPPLNEMLAYYHAWKNDKTSAYIGILQYRRHMILDPATNASAAEDIYGLVRYNDISDNYLNAVGLKEENIKMLMENYDLILPVSWSVENVGSSDLYQHFAAHSPVGIAHLDLALNLIEKDNPSLGRFAREYLRQPLGIFTNLIFAERSIFENYCEWLFKLSLQLEAAIDPSKMTTVQYRMYVSEWMFMIYFSYIRQNSSLRVYEAKRTLIDNPNSRIEPVQPIQGAFDNIVSVATVSSDNYSQHTGALIELIMRKTQAKTFVDFIIVGDGWNAKTKTMYKSFEDKHTNLYVRFHETDGFDHIHTHLHFTKHTFFRFAFPNIFKHYKKIIYLDSDIIVNDDILKLYSIDMQGAALAAVPCTAMRMMMAEGIGCLAECGQYNAAEYVRSYLGMDLSKAQIYFNAGVLLIDIPKMGENWEPVLAEAIEKKNGIFWFVDQDILNSIFAGRVLALEERWNVQNLPMDRVRHALPVKYIKSYQAALANPAIIHYAGGERKPWNDVGGDLASYYWKAVSGSPWFPEALAKVARQSSEGEERSGREEAARLNQELNRLRDAIEGLRSSAPSTGAVASPAEAVRGTKLGRDYSINNFGLFSSIRQAHRVIAKSGMFDHDWYKSQYSIEGGEDRCIVHFLLAGAWSGLSPSKEFDVTFYLLHHPDVAESGMNPLVHYIKHGRSEMREIRPVPQA